MRWHWLLPVVTIISRPVHAIFTDDAFHIDYHQALLGIPQSHTTFFHKPQSSSNATLLYTISDRAILGAVNPRDGSLVWRQQLASQPIQDAADTFLVTSDADGRVTSGFLSSVSSWDALDGRLNWVYNFAVGSQMKGIQTVPNIAQEAENVVQDIVAVAVPPTTGTFTVVRRLSGEDGTQRWEYGDKSISRDSSISLATSPKYVYLVTRSSGLVSGGKAKILELDIVTGKRITSYDLAVESEPVSDDGSLVFASGSEFAFLMTADKSHKSLKFSLLGNSKSATVNLEDRGDEVLQLRVHCARGPGVAPHILVHARGKTKQWAEVFHIDAKKGDVKWAYSLPATAEVSTFAATAVGPAVYFTRITETEVLLYSSESHGQLGRWPRSKSAVSDGTESLHAATEVSTRGAGGIALRVALSASRQGWSLIRNGVQLWSRPENLAYVTRAIWSEDVVAVSAADEIKVEAASDPVTAYVRRLNRHLLELRYLVPYLLNLPNAILQPTAGDGEKSTKEKLIGSKLILASTSRGDILAVDTTNEGAVRWTAPLPRTKSDIPHVVHLAVDGPRLTTYLSDGRFIVIDVATGRVLEEQKSKTPFNKLVELPGKPAATVVKISTDGKPEVFSELAPAVPTEGSVLVTIGPKGEAIGWSIGSSVEQIWTLQPENGVRVTDVVARASHDPIASIGKVLGDRSVYYKYINPNVALLTALSSTALTVYIVNAVTGAVLHTATHAGVVQDLPITVVASGNKFVYSFTTKDATNSGLSSQLVVSELFESDVPNDRGLLQAKSNYSSFSPDAGAKPFVQSKAFTVAEPLSYLSVTQTAQGITSRQILAYLSNSHSIVGIPSEVLDTRRPVDRDPTAEEQEEGLTKYSPILDLDPKFFLSHSRDVLGIQKLMTSPTLLESTSLVFAFGHDVFGTQLAPSNTFDVLGKGFKRIQLVLTVVALYVGVLFLRPVVRQKMVERRWL